MAFTNLSFEYSEGVGATVLSGSAEPWAISTGMQLSVSVGGTSELWEFVAGDGASAATMVAAISAQSDLVQPADDGGYLRLTSLAPGSQSELVVLGGTANTTLLFDSLMHYGVTYFGAPWGWSIDFSYTGKAVREVFTDVVDPTREIFGTAWYAASAFASERIIFTDNSSPSFTERFRVFESGWLADLKYTLPGVDENFTQNDPAVSILFEQFQAYEAGWLLIVGTGTYGPITSAEPIGVIESGTFQTETFDAGTNTVDAFETVMPGERYKVPVNAGDNVFVIGGESYTVYATSMPGGLTALEQIEWRSRSMAAQINRHSQYVRAIVHTYRTFPEMALYLYPIVPLSELYAAAPITLDGVAFTSPTGYPGGPPLAWSWTDYFPPKV